MMSRGGFQLSLLVLSDGVALLNKSDSDKSAVWARYGTVLCHKPLQRKRPDFPVSLTDETRECLCISHVVQGEIISSNQNVSEPEYQ